MTLSALPILTLPQYETEIPIAKKKIKYRPYTVAESKILETAIAMEDETQISLAAAQVIQNCCNVSVSTLHPTDVEWLFIKLRAAATGKVVTVSMNVQCGEDCPKQIVTKVDLDTDLAVEGEEDLIEAGFIKKNNGWLIKITEDVGVLFNIRTSKSNDDKVILHDALECVFDGERIITRDEVSPEEFWGFIENSPSNIGVMVRALFHAQPYIVMNVKGKCPKCGKEHKTKVTGILDFFG